nr:type II toxin-antitoxin system YafQ family toxin [uncultured Prevotella sp.]
MATLMGIVKLLAEDNQIPEEYNPHPLKGNWKNFMECHVKNDTLLIWFDKENDKIELVRLGSHSELFGKGRKR